MNNHPLNLIVRFLLEIILLVIFAYWGWHQFNGFSKFIVAIGLPFIVATLWGVFRVEGDPGRAPVQVHGWVRLLYEAILFILASWFLFQLQLDRLAYWFIAISVLHYLVSYDRIIWMLKK